MRAKRANKIGNFATFNLVKRDSFWRDSRHTSEDHLFLVEYYKGMRCLVDISISIVSRHCKAVVVVLEGTGTKYET